MEELLMKQLGTEKFLPMGHEGGGCISKGSAYDTDFGMVFVKRNGKAESYDMFLGEQAGLEAIQKTGAIRCPKPFGVKSGSCLVTDYIEMGGSSRGESTKKLARQLANMHIHNSRELAKQEEQQGFVGGITEDGPHSEAVTQFGFQVPTCCGFIPMNNTWKRSWPEFFVQNRLKPQIDRLLENKGDRDLLAAYPLLISSCEKSIFANYDDVIPGLVHGDLWGGNWAICDGEPVIFDPAAFFADPEFEQGIMDMFGGYGREVWNEYHSVLPKRKGRETRVRLYELFHHLNHWNHFGSSYKGSAMQLIRTLTAE